MIVVGGGNAGIEASLAGARMGLSVLLVTFAKDKIGYMSCNPSIGGVGKGQLVKELDALGGEMGKGTDATGIQFRMLNSSKGPAVWSSRAQIDRVRYAEHIQDVINRQTGLKVIEGEATGLIVKNNTVTGIELNSEEEISGKTVVLTPGTFLNGTIYIGKAQFPAGRIEEKRASKLLSDSLKELGFEILRFKTGTCARLDGTTINFSKT